MCLFDRFLYLYILLINLLLSGCVSTDNKQKTNRVHNQQDNALLQLKQYQDSDFNEVEVSFYSQQSRALIFRVLTDIDKTPLWFKRVQKLEVLEVYNNQSFLLRTIISTPWPFKDRELISCVNTVFAETSTTINIHACSERVKQSDKFLRLTQMQSSWQLTQIDDQLVKVNYKIWLDPQGHVPAFIYNRELKANTLTDMKKLQTVINQASIQDYPY